jgi:hypothetical protein
MAATFYVLITVPRAVINFRAARLSIVRQPVRGEEGEAVLDRMFVAESRREGGSGNGPNAQAVRIRFEQGFLTRAHAREQLGHLARDGGAVLRASVLPLVFRLQLSPQMGK